MDYKFIYLARRNPSIRLEDWPATWLSHANFAGQFPMIRPNFRSVHYCTRVLTPTIRGALFDPPGASREFDGAAIVSCPAIEGLNIEVPPDIRARIDIDEMRVFSTVTPNFSFKGKEELVHGGTPGYTAVIRFLVRKSGSTPDEFHKHWSKRHADIARTAADASGTVKRYVHNSLLEEPPRAYKFDGIAETWFTNVDDAVRSFVDEAFTPATEDLPNFCDMDRTVTLLTQAIRCWPDTD